MNILKTTLGLLFTFLLAMPIENFAQSAGGQITRRAKTAVKKESPAKKKTVRSSTHSSKKKTERTSPSTKQKPSTTSATQSAAKKAVRSSKPIPNGAVDLGLPSGTLWADRNIGANSPEGYGDYFAWGETRPKSTYSWSTYKYCKGSSDSLTKYCTDSSYGTVDNKTVLEPSDDAATVNWGNSWRMPIREEIIELNEKCTWTWTTRNGVKGYKVVGPNGNSIFLPAAGYRHDSSVRSTGSNGYYWSASLGGSTPKYAWSMILHSAAHDGLGLPRYDGHSVRAVAR